MTTQMTLRSARDGWHYGIETDVPDVDDAGGLLEGDTATVLATVKSLITEYGVRNVDVRDDANADDGRMAGLLADAVGNRRLRSSVTPTAVVAEEA